MHLKLIQKDQFKKQQKQLAILLEIKIVKISKTAPKTNSRINEEEILRERYISPELTHKTIDDLRLKEENYW